MGAGAGIPGQVEPAGGAGGWLSRCAYDTAHI